MIRYGQQTIANLFLSMMLAALPFALYAAMAPEGVISGIIHNFDAKNVEIISNGKKIIVPRESIEEKYKIEEGAKVVIKVKIPEGSEQK